MKKTEEKTNALRLLDAQGVAHQTHSYDPDAVDGEAVAALTGIEPDRVFKTLVTVGASRRYYVFDVPVNCTLSLKRPLTPWEKRTSPCCRKRICCP